MCPYDKFSICETHGQQMSYTVVYHPRWSVLLARATGMFCFPVTIGVAKLFEPFVIETTVGNEISQ